MFEEPFPEDIPARKALLLRHGIAAWDVIGACEIAGSSDASIRNVVPNDLSLILDAAPVQQIFVNGRTVTQVSRELKEKDVVSVRHHGRFRFAGETGRTKKDRLSVKVEVY